MQIPLSTDGFKKLFVVSFAIIDHGCEHQHLLPCILTQNKVNNLIIRILHHFFSRSIGVSIRSAGKEKSQEVIHFGDRSYSRARIARRGLLVNADDRRETCDLVHIGALHRTYISTRVGRERLHIAALPLGKDGIECQ